MVLISWSQVSKTQEFEITEEMIQIEKLEQLKKRELEVYTQITKNSPQINKTFARQLSIQIISKSDKHKVSSKILTAIMMQESTYKVSAQNVQSKDYGIGQINERTIRNFKLNKKLILTNLEYSVEASAIVLADFKRMYGKREKTYWTRYNSGRPVKREVYRKLVSRYL